jgi:gluconolactonase
MAADYLESADPDFFGIVDEQASLEHVATGFGFVEGPVWRGDHLLFSDIPRNRTIRWQMLPEGPQVTTFVSPTGNANGMTLDREGRLVRCEHSGRRVSRIEPDGSVTTLADHYDGKRLNSPNDVIVHSNGNVYFSDPPYGLPNFVEGKELPFNGLFLRRTDGSVLLLADDFDRPNGLALSPDERTLYVADTPGLHIRAFNVRDDGTLDQSRVFAELRASEPGRPDGMKVDRRGNVYSGASGGVWIFTPSGKKLGRIKTPVVAANLAFGDSDWQTLYMTAQTSLYRIRLKVQGIAVGPS